MLNCIQKILVPLFLIVLAPVGLAAQVPGGIDPTQLPPEARELLAQIQQIHAQLQPIQQQALQDPGLQTAQAALNARIQEAMIEVDPSTPQRVERLKTLMAEAQAAQAAQDGAKMGEIVAEAEQIEQRLQAAQAQVFQRSEIAPQVRGFQDRVKEKMIEVDPKAEELIDRLQELDQRLGAVLGRAE